MSPAWPKVANYADWLKYIPNNRKCNLKPSQLTPSTPEERAKDFSNRRVVKMKPVKIIGYDDELTLEEAVAKVKTALMARGPLYATLFVNNAFYTPDPSTGVVANCDADIPPTKADHAVTLVGWDNKKGWLIQNSWGTGYGRNGFAFVPFDCPGIGIAGGNASTRLLDIGNGRTIRWTGSGRQVFAFEIDDPRVKN